MQATNSLPVYGCIDCQRPVDGIPPALYLCQPCRERADEAQRDHRVREAAHDMLAALETVDRCACMDTSVMSPAAVMGICNRCKIVVREAIAKARGGANE